MVEGRRQMSMQTVLGVQHGRLFQRSWGGCKNNRPVYRTEPNGESMADGLLARRRRVDCFQRKRNFNQFFLVGCLTHLCVDANIS